MVHVMPPSNRFMDTGAIFQMSHLGRHGPSAYDRVE